MPANRTIKAFTISESTAEQLQKLPITASQALTTAISNAIKDPQSLGRAMQRRVTQEKEKPTSRTSYYLDNKVMSEIDELCEKSALKGEEVVRLAMEAYIYKL